MRNPTLIVATVILVLCAIAYGGSLGFPYVWDAGPAVEHNRLIASGSVGELLTSDYWAGTSLRDRSLYRPTTTLSFWLERRITTEPDPFVSRLLNVVLYALTALLLFRWGRRTGLDDRACGVAALMVAAHPIGVEVVVNVVGRADLMAAGFSVLALLCFTHAGSWPGDAVASDRRKRTASWLGGLAVLLALGSKETALAVLPLIVLQDLVFRFPGRPRGVAFWIERATCIAPAVLAAVIFIAMRTRALGSFPGLQPIHGFDNVLVGMEGMPRLATLLSMIAHYLKLLLWPVGLSADYSGAAIPEQGSLLAVLPLSGLVVAAALLALLSLSTVRSLRGAANWRWAAMASGLVIFPYLIVGNVIVENGAGFAVRLIAFSALGVWLFVGFGLTQLAGRISPRAGATRIAIVALVILLTVCAWQTRRDARRWQDTDALLSSMLETTPEGLRAHFAMANRRMADGRWQEALDLFDRAVAIEPGHAPAWLYRGTCLARLGRIADGEASIRRSLQIAPRIGEAHLIYGSLLASLNRLAEAERALRKALNHQPNLIQARVGLAEITFAAGRYEEAVEYFRGSVKRGRRDLEGRLRQAEQLAGHHDGR